jgi:hypothetical protein
MAFESVTKSICINIGKAMGFCTHDNAYLSFTEGREFLDQQRYYENVT